MKSDSENGPGAPAPLVSRRKFMLAAAATGGAGLLSAVTGGAGLLPAGLVPMNAHGSADKAAPFVLPKATEDVTPFKVSVPQSAIDDLKRRLASTRWPERETVGDWSEGVPLQKAQALVAYWRDKYDWRRFEARINAFPQYRTQIDGVGIHFIHMRSPQQNALPICLSPSCARASRNSVDRMGWRSAPAHQCSLGKGHIMEASPKGGLEALLT